MVQTPSLRLTSTSFLLPGNPSWRALCAGRNVDFGQYGDWPATLLGAADGAVAWVLFLADVVGVDSLAEQADPSAALAPLLEALDRRLAAADAMPTLVVWSSWRADSPIRSARQPSAWRRLARAWEDALERRAQAHPALLLVDLDPVFARSGMESCFDRRNWYAAHCRLSRQGLERVAGALAAVLDRRAVSARKVLVLDCDNTLWGGVVGEVGLGGLALGQDGQGQIFTDFQRAVAALAADGLILCLASKNNAADVWQVFAEHPGMVLRRDRIVAARIDWNEKADNLRAMADELGLGLGSFVFWDDNPLEREKMRLLAPEVLTPDLPADVAVWPDLLMEMDALAAFRVTDEDRRKVEQYRGVAAFAGERRQAGDETAFLRSIGLRPRRVAIGPATLARAAQLCAKTNQFNLRTVRHGEAELAALAAAPGAVAFLSQLSDRFGDHGLVGLCLARASADPQVAVLDTFLLSCRVLGRHLDAWILEQTTRDLRRSGVRWLVAEYRPTAANVVAKDVLETHGLSLLDGWPEPERHRLRTAALPLLSPEGALFAADLDHLVLPHLEAFGHDDADPA